jgi:uncharacterized repeat protein (TIGR03803 family)
LFKGSVSGAIDGAEPNDIIQGADREFYGTTAGGGGGEYNSAGTVFKLSAGGTETILHVFTYGAAGSTDGEEPTGIIEGADGNFYGTTRGGGTYGEGTVFRLTPTGVETVLYSFTGGVSGSKDGANPITKLVEGSDGSFYGSTETGGTGTCSFINAAAGCGTLFKVTPGGVETVLYSFTYGKNHSSDGASPDTPLIFGSDGDLYGSTGEGGLPYGECSFESSGCGTVFRLTASGQETVLHRFTDGANGSADGGNANGLILAKDGNFYGTALAGGAIGGGMVFKLSNVIR